MTNENTRQASSIPFPGRYRVHLDRVGRNHLVSDLTVDATDGEGLAEAVLRHARRFLGSREVEAAVNVDTGEVLILVGGFRPAGGRRFERIGDAA